MTTTRRNVPNFTAEHLRRINHEVLGRIARAKDQSRGAHLATIVRQYERLGEQHVELSPQGCSSALIVGEALERLRAAVRPGSPDLLFWKLGGGGIPYTAEKIEQAKKDYREGANGHRTPKRRKTKTVSKQQAIQACTTLANYLRDMR